MKITSLRLLNFRSYKKKEFKFDEKINIIIGNNGIGKTNLVEAVYYLAITKSFRTNNDKALIHQENKQFSITGIFKNDKIKNEHKLVFDGLIKKIEVNKTKVVKISNYISTIRVILFNPDDLRLIKENPLVRRKLINIDLSQINNKYLILLSKYNKLLKQRNTYLKAMMINGILSKEYLKILTEKLIDYGMEINKIRRSYFDEINVYLTDIYKKITDIPDLNLKYISHYNDKTKGNLQKEYEKTINKDINYGKTNIGIHLDDFLFYCNDIPIKDFFSEGEQKNAVISLKFSIIEYCINNLNITPILILDDVFSELDSKKIKNILKLLSDNIQVFITTTNLKIISREIITNSKIINLNNENTEALK